MNYRLYFLIQQKTEFWAREWELNENNQKKVKRLSDEDKTAPGKTADTLSIFRFTKEPVMNWPASDKSVSDVNKQQVFTVSVFKSWVNNHPQYADLFTRSEEIKGTTHLRMMADFNNVDDADVLYTALTMVGAPAFKNYVI